MNEDIIIHTIVRRISAFINLNWVDQPFIIYPDVYKKDKNALARAIKQIIDCGIVNDFKIEDFDKNGMKLDLKNATLSEYGKELANMSPIAVRLKSIAGGLKDTYYKLQDEMNSSLDKYELYSDDQLLNMVKRNNFKTPTDRAIVGRVLKNRGY